MVREVDPDWQVEAARRAAAEAVLSRFLVLMNGKFGNFF